MTEQEVKLNDCELVVKMLWPEWELLENNTEHTAIIVGEYGHHRTLWLFSPLDVREMERKLMSLERSDLWEEYGRALIKELWGDCADYEETAHVHTASLVYSQVARLATATTEQRAKALIALAKSRQK